MCLTFPTTMTNNKTDDEFSASTFGRNARDAHLLISFEPFRYLRRG